MDDAESRVVDLRGRLASLERDIPDLDIEGSLPEGLDGAFIRVGGIWAVPPKFADDSPFSQDGYVSSFRIAGGRVAYRGRWIRTHRFQANLAAGRQMYGYYRNPYTDDLSVRDLERPELRTVMNTAPFTHAGRLFAAKEDALPYELDPVSLDTLGNGHDFEGGYRSPTFTAHPKTDPVTGDLVCYGYEAGGLASDDLWLYVITKEGKVAREIRLKVPYVSMVHDIVLTEKHIVIPVFPCTTSLERLRSRAIHWGWDASLPNYYGVLPRDGDANDVRWFKGPARAVVHALTGRTEEGRIVIEGAISEANPFPFFPSIDGAPWDPVRGTPVFRRITIDLAGDDEGVHEEILFAGHPVSDLARIDPSRAGLACRYAFSAFSDPERIDHVRVGPTRRAIQNCYGMFDLSTNSFESVYAGPTHTLAEPSFVPRGGSAKEGDGFLLGVATDLSKNLSELLIADTRALSRGPIARVKLPFLSDFQVHGGWYTATDLPGLASQET
jgi:carotenoid cleavage dioxygenase-like enzyme